jgi:outer membrane protein OmpA-like peptidoglycan-associated protein
MMRAPGKTATADSSPALPPAAALIAPGASALAPLGAGDAKKPPSEQTAALWPPSQATPIIPLPAPVKTPDQQAVLTPPSQATPRAPERDPVAAEPAPQRTGKGGTVSLQAAEINFVGNGLTLTADDDRRLADVLKLYDKHGGVVRVVGYGRRGYGADAAQQELASFSKAIERANVVAKALAQLGLASNRIVVQAAPVGDGLGEDRAEVLLEF